MLIVPRPLRNFIQQRASTRIYMRCRFCCRLFAPITSKHLCHRSYTRPQNRVGQTPLKPLVSLGSSVTQNRVGLAKGIFRLNLPEKRLFFSQIPLRFSAKISCEIAQNDDRFSHEMTSLFKGFRHIFPAFFHAPHVYFIDQFHREYRHTRHTVAGNKCRPDMMN